MFVDYLFRQKWIAPVLLVLLIVAAHANGTTGPFLWDDLEIVVNNPIIRSWDNISSIFTASVFGNVAGGNEFYRPLVTLSFLLNYQFAELAPFTYHLVNMLLHIGSTLLLYGLLPKLQLSKAQALFVSAVFAVHPIGIEVVTFVSGRSDAVASFFMLLAIFAYVQPKQWWLVVCGASLGAALLSKESAVTIPPLLLLISYFYPKQRSKAKWTTAAVLFLIAAAYALQRISGLDDGTGSLSWIAQASITERLLTVPYALLAYLRITFWPNPLHMEYHTVVTSLTHWSIWLSVSIFAIVLAVIRLPILGFRMTNTELRIPTFWLLWFFIGLAPVLNIIAPQTSTVREHWLYIPAISLYVLVAKLSFWKKADADNLCIAAISVITALGLLTYERNRDWLNPLQLYTNDVQLEPRSFTLWNNAGTQYFAAGNMAAAEQAFTKAITESPGEQYAVAHNNLGVIAQNKGEYQRALQLYLRSIELTQYQLGYANAIELLTQLGQLEQAEALRKQAQQQHPFRNWNL